MADARPRPLLTPGLLAVDYEIRVDADRLRRYRLERAQAALDASECGAFLLFDFYNIRYTTQSWVGGALGVMSRQVVEPADGWASDGGVVPVMIVEVDPVG